MSDAPEPIWINKKQALYVQSETIKDKGGTSGIRDEGLLESALARPQNHFAYGERDIFELAATYAEGLSRNHVFVDGNKRTAYIVSGMFLQKNGHKLNVEQEREQIELFENLAQGKASCETVSAFYRKNTQEIDHSKNS